MNGKVPQKMFWKIKFWSEKRFFPGRKPAQKDKRLYQNWSPRSGTKFGKKSKKSKKVTQILEVKKSRKKGPNCWYFLCFYCKNICFLQILGEHTPLGARWAGPPLLFLGWKYWKSPQEKVSRKPVLYFLGKIVCFIVFADISKGRAPSGARWAGPPLLFLGWKYWKSSEEKVSRETVLYFLDKNIFFGNFTYQNALKPIYLDRQISSRGYGRIFFRKLIENR